MPPKKKEAAGKAQGDEPEPDEEEKDLLERELVISYLKSKLGRYQEQGEKLHVENIKLSEELDAQKGNLRDVNEFLTNELKARSLATTELEEKLAELDKQRLSERAQLKAEISKLKSENESQRNSLESSIHDYEKKMKGTQEFLDKKEQLEADISELRRNLEKMSKESQAKISDMERQHIQDKERWKREMAQKIKETKAQMMKLTDNQLEMTTKRTIMENEQMCSELAYQSRQTEKLLGRNQGLLDENSEVRRQVELARQTQEELAKRNFVYQKAIRTLLGKMRSHDAQKEEDESLMLEMARQMKQLEEADRFRDMEMQNDNHELRLEVEDLRAKLAKIDAAYDGTAKFIAKCMEDVHKKLVTVVPDEGHGVGKPSYLLMPGRLEELSLEQRERALSYLLGKLHLHCGAAFREAVAGPREAPSRQGSRLGRLPTHRRRDWDHLRGPVHITWPGQTPLSTPSTGQMGAVSAGTQTQSLALATTDDLAEHLFSGLRPWGAKSKHMPQAELAKDNFLRKGPNRTVKSVGA
eukprot:evm.model.scf_1052.4 EVM.evm.TU.scf_1052.4   scf_1052:32928-39739(+)